MKKKKNSMSIFDYTDIIIGCLCCFALFWAGIFLVIWGYKHFYYVLHLDYLSNIEMLREQANFIMGLVLFYGFSKGFNFYMNYFIKDGFKNIKNNGGKIKWNLNGTTR